MKVAFVITGLGVGGAEKVVTSLADSLVERGHDVAIAYLTGEALTKPGGSAIQLVNLKVRTVFDMLTAYFRLRSFIKEFNPDVVHTHLVHANILTRLVSISIDIPRLITTAHNKNEEGWYRMLAYRLTDSLSDLSTNVSDEAVASFVAQRAVKPERMITVHNGISTSEYFFSAEDKVDVCAEFCLDSRTKLLVAVGRLDEQKDYPNLLLAISKMKEDDKDYKVLIAGDGPLREKLSALSESYGLTERVHFLGLRRDIRRLLSAADVFVLSSAWEGFPMVVGEAMSCECLVVGTDCGGVREFLGDTGFLLPSKNSDELASNLDAALALSEQNRSIYGKSARCRVQELYSLNAATDKWLMLYSGASQLEPTHTSLG